MLKAILSAIAIMGFAQCALAQTGQVMFSYQGRVKVTGQPYNGTGQFKLAILTTSGTASLWSHDNTSINGSEPASSISLPVSDGVFDVLVGNTSIAGMTQAINPAIFQSKTPLKLRVWFSDGVHGFQQLNPDFSLVNLALVSGETGSQDFALYVNGTTGSDANNGLTPTTAKKTIQAAMDTLPPIVRCNVTVNIAAGTYREFVNVSGISAGQGKAVTLLGDTSWTTASVSEPNVRITGSDAAADSVPVRELVLSAQQCSGLTLKGILFSHGKAGGVRLANGLYTVTNCKSTSNSMSSTNEFGFASTDSGFGFMFTQQCTGNINGSVATGNAGTGIYGIQHAIIRINSCFADRNAYGIMANTQCYLQCSGSGHMNSNTANGAHSIGHSAIDLSSGYVLQGNTAYSAQAGWMSSVGVNGATVNNTNAFQGSYIF